MEAKSSPNQAKGDSNQAQANPELKDIGDVGHLVQTFLQQVQDKFQMMSDQILNRIDEMAHRIDDLEQNLTELMQQAGVSDEASVSNALSRTSNASDSVEGKQ